MPVIAELARLDDVPSVLSVVGTVDSPADVAVRPQVSGVLLQVAFREGQDVHRNDLLATLDSRPFEAAVRQAEAALERDRAQLEQARQDAQRYAELAAKDYTTREQYEKLRTAAAVGEAQVKVDQATADNARLQLAYCTIRSPIDGRTGRRLVDAGNVVQANVTVLVDVQQLDPIHVAFAVPEEKLADVRRGQQQGALRVTATPQGAAQAGLDGQLFFVDNAVDRTTGTVLLKASFANPGSALWPGQFVKVELQLALLKQVVVVPATALQPGQQGSFVYVVRADNTAEVRPVVPGPSVKQRTVIEQGLKPGELVVTDGQLRLVPDSRVEVRPPSPPGGTAPGGPRSVGPPPAPEQERQAAPAAAADGGQR